MSKIEINNLLCYDQAEFEIEPGCTIVTGPNSAGKTSLATIIAAVTAQDGNPLHLSATAQKAYVKAGRIDGVAILDDGVRWAPPDGIAVPTGISPQAAPHAVGLVDFCRPQPAKARAQIWETLVMPSDAQALLEPEWKLPQTQLKSVLAEISRAGWEAAAKIYEDQRAEAKRQWAQVTGAQRWGSKIAASWVPEHWSPDLEGASVEKLSADIEAARDRLRALNAVVAVSQHQIAEAIEARDTLIPALDKELADLLTKDTAAEKTLQENEQAIRPVREAIRHTDGILARMAETADDGPLSMPCPKCGAKLVSQADGLVEFSPPTPEEKQEYRDRLAAMEAKQRDDQESMIALEKTRSKLRDERRDLSSQINHLQGRRSALVDRAKLADAQPTAGADEAEIAKTETEVRDAETRYKAFRTQQHARRLHNTIVELEAVCGLLGPNGVRSAHMAKFMDKIRAVIANTEKYTGWLPVGITGDYQLSSDGRPVQLVAENEKMKAQWLCQMSVAFLDANTKWVVLDCGDRLRGEHWDGLVSVCNAIAARRDRLRIVLCATEADTPEGWAEIRL